MTLCAGGAKESLLTVFFNDEQIVCINKAKDLGVTLNGWLGFDDHLQSVYKSSMFKLECLDNLINHLDGYLKLKLFKSLV